MTSYVEHLNDSKPSVNRVLFDAEICLCQVWATPKSLHNYYSVISMYFYTDITCVIACNYKK